MKYQYLFILLFIVNFSIKAQSHHPSISDTFYYPFEDNIQMIEIAFQKKYINQLYSRGNNYKSKDNTTYYRANNMSGYIDNIYIFRDINGQIINIYNQQKQTIDFNKLRPISDSIYSEHFLLYQYILGKYEDTITNKTIYFWSFEDANHLQGIINQKGEIIVNPQYDIIQYDNKENIVLTHNNDRLGIIYLNNLDKNIEPIFENQHYNPIPNSSWIRSQISYSPTIIDNKTGKILFMFSGGPIIYIKGRTVSIDRDKDSLKEILTLRNQDTKTNTYTIKIDLETIYKKLISSDIDMYREPLPH